MAAARHGRSSFIERLTSRSSRYSTSRTFALSERCYILSRPIAVAHAKVTILFILDQLKENFKMRGVLVSFQRDTHRFADASNVSDVDGCGIIADELRKFRG